MAYKKEKLESQILRVLSELIIKEVKDPRIGFVTITKVTVNRDYSEARVGISVLGDPRDMRKSLEGLKSSTGFLQYRLNRALAVRHAPRIMFELDSSVVEGTSMVDLLDSLSSESEQSSPSEENNE